MVRLAEQTVLATSHEHVKIEAKAFQALVDNGCICVGYFEESVKDGHTSI